MTGCVLLVYGSRALNDTENAMEWAATRIEYEITRLPIGSTVISGGCPDSPDEWTRIIAKNSRQDITMVEFRLDGHKWRNGEHTEEIWLDLAPAGAERARGTPRWPLRRNDAMAMALLRAHVRRWDACAIGLRAPWTTTGGTDYMTSKLKETPWSVLSCPVSLGPSDKVAAMHERVASGNGKW